MTAGPTSDARPTVRVRLYVAGTSPNSTTALRNLNAALADFPDHGIDVEIIDVLSHPQRGLDDGILVTPMLVKTLPRPERRILGSLRDRDLLLSALGLPVLR